MSLQDVKLVSLSDSSVRRELRLRPSTCGHSFLFVSQIGDWMWDAVTSLCDTDVFTARNQQGAPAYLAFYYLRMRATPALHLGSFAFGDEIGVTSQLFSFGSESVLAAHRVGRLAEGTADPLTVEEVHESRRPHALYIENCSRWVSRTKSSSNENLVRAAPPDFRTSHLPSLPERYSPRPAWGDARLRGTFHDETSPDYKLVVEHFELSYAVDIARDLNAIGLVYFSAFFSIIDWATVRLWRHLGRSDDAFLSRIITDHRMCFLSNAEQNAQLGIKLKLWRSLHDPSEEILNVVVADGARNRTILIATIQLFNAPSAARRD